MANRRLMGLGLAVAVLVLMTACGRGPTPAERAADDQILLLGNGAEPKGLDPHLTTGVTESNIIQALIEGLIAYHPTDDMKPAPGVATSWSANDDQTVWTFRLRPDAVWSNGEPVTAHDFVYSYRRILSPALGAEYADMLHIIENAEAYHRGQLTDFDSVGVRARDPRTLEIRLTGPTPYFPSMLKHHAWYPVHPETIEAFGGMTNRNSEWTDPANYVGNGAFELTEWTTNSRIVVEKNPDYWDAESVVLEAIHFFPIAQASTELRTYRNGQLHVTSTLPADLIERMREEHPEAFRSDPYLGTYFYRFNVTRPPLDDPRVREALTLAIDRAEITQFVTRGGEKPAHGFTPDGLQGYTTPQPLTHDPERARRLLDEAGYPEGEGFPTLEVLINTSETHRRVAEAIQSMWQESLGIEIAIDNKEWKVYLDAQSRLDYDISRSGWIGDFMDPITFLSLWTTEDGNNDTGWSHADYDTLIQRAQHSRTTEAHFRLLREAEGILLDALPVAPIYWYTQVYMKHPRLEGWAPKLLDNRPYKALRFQAAAE